MYDDTEDVSTLQDTVSLDKTPPNHSIPKQDGE